jgi:hypothetical protein
MRLTNYIRDAFIEAAMQDIPKKKSNLEEMSKIAQEDINSRLPKNIKKIWLENTDERDFLIVRHDSFKKASFCYPSTSAYSSGSRPLRDSVKAKLELMAEENDAECKKLNELRSKLKGAAYACTTTKQLRDLLPDFSKYLPNEEEQTARSLPVVANIVEEFKKAGWPKTQPKGNTK